MLEPKPCPAGKCDAQIYSVGELVFCIKCGAKNPNFKRSVVTRERTRTPSVRTVKQQPVFDPVTGAVKWT